MLANQTFELPPVYIENLWEESTPVLKLTESYPVLGNIRDNDRRARVSPDNNWLIRRNSGSDLPQVDLSLDDVVKITLQELERLQAIGQSVISRAMAVNGDNNAILALSPLVPDLKPLEANEGEMDRLDALYELYIESRLAEQRECEPAYILEDIRDPDQYSTLPGCGDQPVMHDIDPCIKLIN